MKIYILLLLPLFFSCGITEYSRIGGYDNSFFVSNKNKETFHIDWNKNLSKAFFNNPNQIEFNSPIFIKEKDNDSLLIGTSLGELIKVDYNSGVLLKRNKLKKAVVSQMVLIDNSLLFFSSDGYLYKTSINGKVIWQTLLENERVISDFEIKNNKAYFKSSKERIYCVDLTKGDIVWVSRSYESNSFTIQAKVNPLIIDNLLYMGFADGKFVAFDIENGKSIFETTFSTSDVFNDISADLKRNNDVIYIPSYQNGIIAFNYKTQLKLWETGTAAHSSLTVINNNIGYYFSDTHLVKIDILTGQILKRLELNISNIVGYSLFKEKYLLVASRDEGIVFIDLNNKNNNSRFYLGSGVNIFPLILNNKLIFMSNSGDLYKMEIPLLN